MGRLEDLKAEIDTDPLTRGYGPMTDKQVADDLMTVYRSVAVDSVTPGKFMGAIKAATHWGAVIADTDRDYVMGLAAMNPVPVGETWVQAKLTGGANGIFDAVTETATFDALEALYDGTISRAQELGLGVVKEGTVAQARAL